MRSPPRPAHSELLYRLSYPGPLDICVFFQNLSRKLKFLSNLTRIRGTLHAHLCTFKIVHRWILLRKRKFSNKSRTENKNPQFVFSTFPLENLAVCEIIWQNMVETDKRMRFRCWINNATDTLRTCNTFLFDGSNCYSSVPECYVVCALLSRYS